MAIIDIKNPFARRAAFLAVVTPTILALWFLYLAIATVELYLECKNEFPQVWWGRHGRIRRFRVRT
jgi:hypothetical protein